MAAKVLPQRPRARLITSCLQDVEENSSDDDGRNGHYHKKAYAYHSHGVKAGYLRSKILTSRNPIYKCHESCACGANSPNRVVERGRTVPLRIFRTKNRGWGVRCMVDMKKGQFVDTYIGEICKDVYLFALDKFVDPQSFDERRPHGPPLKVDGEFLSGPTRFINHSCDPATSPAVGNLRLIISNGVEDSDTNVLDHEKQKDMTKCLSLFDACQRVFSLLFFYSN
ncbi:hypothetical protein F5Y16DRAFT_414329 [Xylariaceae sp. FL0255]|nr:hypothetical protein F5Y16DRAFT_414329 [Xylariaceae sp. FL0255]